MSNHTNHGIVREPWTSINCTVIVLHEKGITFKIRWNCENEKINLYSQLRIF